MENDLVSLDEPAASVIRLALYSGFQLTLNGVEVRMPAAAQRLVAFLALNRRAVHRSRVAGILWANVPDGRAAGNLRSAIWRLRQSGLDLIGGSGSNLILSPAVSVDVDQVDHVAQRVGDLSASLVSLSLDQIPFGGELLPGWDDEWVLLERERHRQIMLHVLDALCERWTHEGRFPDAVRAGLAAVGSEPLRESSQRALIKAFQAEGNAAEAIRQYEIYRQRLQRELGLEPSVAISRLVRTQEVTAG